MPTDDFVLVFRSWDVSEPQAIVGIDNDKKHAALSIDMIVDLRSESTKKAIDD